MRRKLTSEQVVRVKNAVVETHRLLAHELEYQKHLQNHELIAAYKKHLGKLNEMLRKGTWEAAF